VMCPRRECSRIMDAPRVAALALCLVLAITPAPAAPPSRVLVVTSDDLPQYRHPVEAFVAAYAGDARVIDIGDSKESGRASIEEAMAQGPIDAIFAVGARAAWVSHKVLPDVPLAFAMVIDWQRYGLGDKASGISVELPVDALLTRFKLLLPHLRRLGVIYSDQAPAATLADAGLAAAELGIELVREPVNAPGDVPGAYRRIRSRIDALWMIPDPVVVTRDNFRYLANRTLHDDVAFLAFSENFVRAGALLSVSPDYATMGSQAAALIDRIVTSKASSPSVQAPIGSSLVVNAETARALGIDVDLNMLSLADKVIDSDE
jgi:putative ABC transport system substrate-binding protein